MKTIKQYFFEVLFIIRCMVLIFESMQDDRDLSGFDHSNERY